MSEFFLNYGRSHEATNKTKTRGSNKQEKITFKKLTNCQYYAQKFKLLTFRGHSLDSLTK